jgi:hypothetical protein
MIKIINNRIYYLGANGHLFKDITDDYFRFILNKK